MQNPIQISVDIPGLDRLIAALERIAPTRQDLAFQQPQVMPSAPPPTPPTPPTPFPAPPQQPLVASAAPAAPPMAAPVLPTSTPTYTLDDLMRAGSSLADAGKREAVVGLITQFGVPALTQIPPERYGEFAAALRGLGAQL